MFSRSPTWTTQVLASESSHGSSSFLQLWCRLLRHHHGRVISTSLSLPTTVLFSTEHKFKSQSHEHDVCTVGSGDCELLVRVLLSPLHVESCLSGQTAIVLLHRVGIGWHVHEHMSREIRCWPERLEFALCAAVTFMTSKSMVQLWRPRFMLLLTLEFVPQLVPPQT